MCLEEWWTWMWLNGDEEVDLRIDGWTVWDMIWERWKWEIKWRMIKENGRRRHTVSTPMNWHRSGRRRSLFLYKVYFSNIPFMLYPRTGSRSIPEVSSIFHLPKLLSYGHRPLQLLAISLELRLLASSSCQPSCANRHSTWLEGVLHYVYRDAVSTPVFVYPSGCRFYGWYGQSTATVMGWWWWWLLSYEEQYTDVTCSKLIPVRLQSVLGVSAIKFLVILIESIADVIVHRRLFLFGKYWIKVR
jgi:hypothetical protein